MTRTLLALILATPSIAAAQASDGVAFYVDDAETIERCAREVRPLAAAIRAARGARAERRSDVAAERRVASIARAVSRCRVRAGIDPPPGVDRMPMPEPPPPEHALAEPFVESLARVEGAQIDERVVLSAIWGNLGSRCQFRLGPGAPSGGAVEVAFSIDRAGRPARVETVAADAAAQRVEPCARAILDAALLPALRAEARFRLVVVFPPFGGSRLPRGTPSVATIAAFEAEIMPEARAENERILRYATDALAECHTRAAPPAPNGTVRFEHRIGSDGNVSSPNLVADTLRRPDLHQCLYDAVRVRYAATRAPYTLRFTIDLRAR